MSRIAPLLAIGLAFAVFQVLAETLPQECRMERGATEETFDNTTVRRRTVAPGYSASAESGACSRCLLDVYVFMGASVTGVNVDMLLRNVHRRGKLNSDLGALEEVMARHCPHAVGEHRKTGERRNR
jgi:hypothetical protein